MLLACEVGEVQGRNPSRAEWRVYDLNLNAWRLRVEARLAAHRTLARDGGGTGPGFEIPVLHAIGSMKTGAVTA